MPTPAPEAEAKATWKIIPTVTDVDEDLRAGKLIHHRVVDTTAAIVSVKEKAKATSSIIKYGIETFESLADPLMKPVLKTVDESLVARLDPMITYAYTKAIQVSHDVYKAVENGEGKSYNIFQGLVVKSEWFEKVDEIINPSKITPEDLVRRFYVASKSEFAHLLEIAKAAKVSMETNSADFINGLRKQMKDTWDEKLKEPAIAFYKAAQAEYKRVNTSGDGYLKMEEVYVALKPVWEEKVVKAFEARLRPAVVMYKSILGVYANYRKMAEEKGLKVSAEAFVSEVKACFKDVYDERLAPYIREFYEGASKIVTEDLLRIVRALDVDQKKVTLNDFVIMTNALVQRYVETPYKAVLASTMKAVDMVVPEAKEEKEMTSDEVAEDLSLSLVTKTVSKRLVKKAVAGLSNIKLRAETLIGPDLIKTAQDLLKERTEQLAPIFKNLETKMEDFKAIVATKVKPVQDVAVSAIESKRAQELRKRFHVAIKRVSCLAKDSFDYLLYRELILLPSDMGKFFAVTVGIREKDEDYVSLVDSVTKLFNAMIDVVMMVKWSPEMKYVKDADAEEEAHKGEEKSKLLKE
ncbi:hypothetical protein AAMO2058_001615700 [Amorphochlora amoebiformis]|eukprot:1349822-Amorphochlora_amoeboformis.AAC.1